jgi:pimeloyl-ACP methyl ester carboxylesterase
MAADDAGVGVSGRYVRANGLDIYYEEYGAGPPLVDIHAGTSTILHRPAFGARFRVVAPNTRGHGRTANPSGAMSYGLLADDVAALIGALGLDRPPVHGYSIGGTTALELSMRHPGVAGALVLGGAWHRLSPGFHEALRRLNGLAGNGEADLGLPERTHPYFVAEWQETHAALGGPDYWKDLLRQLWPMIRAPLGRAEPDLGRIAVPTLVVVGDRDDVAPAEEALALYRLIPGAELAVVPGADHFLPWTHAALYEAVVLDFLLRHGGGVQSP